MCRIMLDKFADLNRHDLTNNVKNEQQSTNKRKANEHDDNKNDDNMLQEMIIFIKNKIESNKDIITFNDCIQNSCENYINSLKISIESSILHTISLKEKYQTMMDKLNNLKVSDYESIYKMNQYKIRKMITFARKFTKIEDSIFDMKQIDVLKLYNDCSKKINEVENICLKSILMEQVDGIKSSLRVIYSVKYITYVGLLDNYLCKENIQKMIELIDKTDSKKQKI